jgi:hypothetical protein
MAAEQGNASAQNNLGAMYSKGQGIPQSFGEALKWYRRAADQGSAAAQSNLGFLYRDGHGVPQDYAEAMKWWRKAAEQGHADAQNILEHPDTITLAGPDARPPPVPLHTQTKKKERITAE